MTNWVNDDGLTVQFGSQEQEKQAYSLATTKRLAVTLTGEDIPSSVATPGPYDAFIPAGSYILSAHLIVTEAFTSGGSATLTIGTYEGDATAIDADGIDAAIAVTAIDAVGDVVVNDGAQVGGVTTVGSDNAYIQAIYGTAAFTAGEATLVIEYIEP